MREPDVAADDGVMANSGAAAENRRSRIYRNVIFEIGVALICDAANQFSFGIAAVRGIERAERDTVVERNVISDDGSFSDDHAGPVIDEKRFTDGCSGMNINTGDRKSV